MLLECLDAQGTFLQRSAFYSIGFPYEADRAREREVKVWGHTERERGCKKIQVWRNIVKLTQMHKWNLYFAPFLSICFLASG